MAWQIQARSLLCAANVLRERSFLLVGGQDCCVPDESEDPPELRYMPVFLLCGYALENLVKGLLVARGETATWTGTLDPQIRHHCLGELFRVAGVHTTGEDRKLLDDLRDVIESGKYPVATKPRPRPKVLKANPRLAFDRIFGLIGQIEAKLRNICLDGVLPPCDPSRIGLPWRV
jgi:hypothetical protein